MPALLYVIWWFWATSAISSSDSTIAVENLLALPAWMFQLLGYALAAFSGLAYDFGGGEILPALAIALAVAGIGRRLVAAVEPRRRAGAGRRRDLRRPVRAQRPRRKLHPVAE